MTNPSLDLGMESLQGQFSPFKPEFQQNNFTDLNEIILHSYIIYFPLVCCTLEEFQK